MKLRIFKSSFGLDISDHSIEVLELSSKNKVKAFARILLEQGIVKDGKILNKEKLAEKIKEVVAKAKIKSKKVVLALPESKTFIHFFEKPEDIKEQAAKLIPWNLEEIYFDIQDTLYVAVPKSIVDGYLEVLNKLGLEPIAFEIESLALGRALRAKNCLVVDIGARTTNLSIFDKNKKLKISANVAMAGNHFTKSIADKLKISLREAEKLKASYGLNETKKEGEVMLVLQKELQPIIEKIKKIINFYGKDINQVLLVGGSAQIPKIDSYFSSNLNLKVSIGKSSIAKQLKQKSILFNMVIGLALRALKRKPETAGINLLPAKKKPEPAFVGEKLNKSKIFTFVIIAFVILGFVFLGWVVYQYIYKPIFQPAQTETSLAPIEPEPEPVIEEVIVMVVIKETPTGWLRVREGPGTNYSEIDKVYPGESFPLLEEKDNWYKIELEDNIAGWISANYAEKL